MEENVKKDCAWMCGWVTRLGSRSGQNTAINYNKQFFFLRKEALPDGGGRGSLTPDSCGSQAEEG